MFINRNYTRGGAIKCKIEKVMIFHIVLTAFPEATGFYIPFYIYISIEFKLDSVKEEDFCVS